jgi:hypothetical protein
VAGARESTAPMGGLLERRLARLEAVYQRYLSDPEALLILGKDDVEAAPLNRVNTPRPCDAIGSSSALGCRRSSPP